jgi:hypothetical protein
MKRLIQNPFQIFLIIGFFLPTTTKADVWDNPHVKRYYSQNKEYELVVTPQIIPSKYYEWYYYQNRHPQTRKILRREEKFMRNLSGQDTILIPCTAELFRINVADSSLLWKKPLLNYYCPVNAIVANDGSSIATFDNWYSMGYGVNVFVIYNEKGEAERTYKLEEITPFPLNDFMRSISSIHWYEEARYIDYHHIEINFETEDNRQTKRIYNIQLLEFENNAP